MKRQSAVAVAVFCVLVALGIASRLLREVLPGIPPNFHAIIATTLFAGLYFRSRAAALAVPLAAMLLSDLVLGGYDPGVMVAVYGSLLAPIVWRGFLKERLSASRVGLGAIGAALIFYFVSNFAVWWCGWYPPTGAALVRCYLAALPFFGYELLGDLAFSALVFGAYALLREAQQDPAIRTVRIARPVAV